MCVDVCVWGGGSSLGVMSADDVRVVVYVVAVVGFVSCCVRGSVCIV